MTTAIEQLTRAGQSIWLDFISREMLYSGKLQRYVDDGWVTGLTSNPSIFAKAIAGSTDYDAQLREVARSGERDPYQAFVALAVDDIQRAADLFRPVYEHTRGADGYVSLEAPPGLEHDVERTVAEVKRLSGLVDRPNVMIKVPGTDAGVEALTQLTTDGVNVNVTLLFSVDVYERFALGYIEGLERRLDQGLPMDGVASVASFFVSRVDSVVDRELPQDSPLRGEAAIANALTAYGRFRKIVAGERWQRLGAAGARVQRPLWGSTSTKDPAYSDVLYVERLIAPDTVNTMPEPTLQAFAEHGNGTPVADHVVAEAPSRLAEIEAAGINKRAVTDRLLREGLDAFASDFQGLLQSIEKELRRETAK